ncbi:uncharacterized protein MICPUCDRAFT_55252 [Micromonas pusilla CCMP1545]|uniref:Predicted protein n=1 Tax=Micromonas pusilla (strain CCMP1545) TaxID=564608 RepID=C1MKA1_MICPC|nr:uncharacterized protein MICPUCDRAFT_55252 [Micromonas pusilla CCMP1545]EEH59336.1 predicted protein [Micromonas pusilla CCMP1545]|eukprot:XP_003055960.1 predicted protein [Micromonas pusilla CCMP1545]
MTDDTQKIGIGLTSFGVLFMALGVLFFFDRALLSFGNVLFIAGVSLTIGRKRALKFFVNRRRVRSGNHRGSVCFLGGLALVLFGWPFVGCARAFRFDFKQTHSVSNERGVKLRSPRVVPAQHLTAIRSVRLTQQRFVPFHSRAGYAWRHTAASCSSAGSSPSSCCSSGGCRCASLLSSLNFTSRPSASQVIGSLFNLPLVNKFFAGVGSARGVLPV